MTNKLYSSFINNMILYDNIKTRKLARSLILEQGGVWVLERPLKLPPLTFDPFDHAEADGTTAAWLAAF